MKIFHKFMELFRGSITDSIVANLLELQHQRALSIAAEFVTDVYVYDDSAYFSTAEQRRFEVIYYHFREGKYAVLEPSVQNTLRNVDTYRKLAPSHTRVDRIGAYVPFDQCLLKKRGVTEMLNPSDMPLSDRVAAMRQFVDSYDKARQSPSPALGVENRPRTPRSTHKSV